MQVPTISRVSPIPNADGLSVPVVTGALTIVPAVLAAVQAALPAQAFLDWGGGLAWIAGPASPAAHNAVAAAARDAGGVWTLMRAPDTLREAVAVVPPEPPALARIGQHVKAAFDPRGILNPGRIVAGV